MMLISVVVPTYNEEDNIPIFYDRVSSILTQTGYDWEIIFVDDGSKDRSAEVVRDYHQKDARVKLLGLSRNFGAYSAVSAGWRHARGDAIISLNCDLQDPPELIPEFVQRWENGADVVWGIRQERDDPGLKSFYANLFYWILRKTIWGDFPAGGMDFGLFDRRIIDLYNNLQVRNTIPFLTVYNMGFRQEQIPYDRLARQHGQSNWGMLRRIKAAIDVIVDFSYVPIRAISTLGVVMSLFGFTYALVVFVSRILFGTGSSGWPSIVIIVSVSSGAQLIVLGVLGEYIWRIAEQVRDRPHFLVMDRAGFEGAENPGNYLEQHHPHSHDKENRKE